MFFLCLRCYNMGAAGKARDSMIHHTGRRSLRGAPTGCIPDRPPAGEALMRGESFSAGSAD